MKYNSYVVRTTNKEDAKEVAEYMNKEVEGKDHPFTDKYYMDSPYHFRINYKEMGTSCANDLDSLRGVDHIFEIQEWRDYIKGEEVPEKWAINAEHHEEIGEWFNKNNLVKGTEHGWNYINHSGSKYLVFPNKLGISSHYSKEIPEGYTELTLEEFKSKILKQPTMNKTGNYSIKGCQGLVELIKKYSLSRNLAGNADSDYYHYEGAGGISTYSSSPKYTVITAEQLEEILTGAPAEKKVIGYLAPTDLFQGEIKKGTTYKALSSTNVRSYAAFENGNVGLSKHNLPKEIVETWEPTFEEPAKTIQIGKPAFDVLIQGDSVVISKYGVKTTKKDIQAFLDKMPQSNVIPNTSAAFGGNDVRVKEVTLHVGCSEGPDITLTELKTILIS